MKTIRSIDSLTAGVLRAGAWLLLTGPLCLSAQEEDVEGDEEVTRVQYALILPEEKMPETVNPDETNPFQSAEDQARSTGDSDTEENRVSEILLGLPVTGVSYTTHGMRVLLGDMRLEIGAEVPKVVPDQVVSLKVKSITPTAVELTWVEDKLTGLAPRSLVIPINVAPTVRYLLQGHMAEGKSIEEVGAPFVGMKRGRIRGLNTLPSSDDSPDSSSVAGSTTNAPRATLVEDEEPEPAAEVGPGEAVVRMLFGTGSGGQ